MKLFLGKCFLFCFLFFSPFYSYSWIDFQQKLSSLFPVNFSSQVKEKPSSASKKTCTKQVVIEGIIGVLTVEVLNEVTSFAKQDNCSSILLLINTPGGLLSSTRKLVEIILNSEIPFLCLVHPSGAHAGSAGAILLQACHVNGGVQATNLGAATPVLQTSKDTKGILKKVINDTVSWMDSITFLRGRNKEFGRKIVTEAKSVSAKEAKKIGAIDFFGETKEEFLNFAQGRRVQVQDKKNVEVVVGAVQNIDLGIRHKFIQFVTDPEIVYLLFLGSIFLIYIELTNPGMFIPLILGGIGLVVSFIGMSKIGFVWGGAILILFGMLALMAEIFVTGFGLFALLSSLCFIIGSFFLFDPTKTGGVMIPTSTIIIASTIFSVFSIILTYITYTSIKKKIKGGTGLLEEKGVVVELKSDYKGLIEIQGETWKFYSKDKLKKGDVIKTLSYKRMCFEVEKCDVSMLK